MIKLVNEDLAHIVKEVKATYEEYFTTLGTIELDIATYNVQLTDCMLAFIDICFGKTLEGGSPKLKIKLNEPIIFDDLVLFSKPTLQEIFATLISFSTENGNPKTYIKD